MKKQIVLVITTLSLVSSLSFAKVQTCVSTQGIGNQAIKFDSAAVASATDGSKIKMKSRFDGKTETTTCAVMTTGESDSWITRDLKCNNGNTFEINLVGPKNRAWPAGHFTIASICEENLDAESRSCSGRLATELDCSLLF